ncbi:hypothetical protein TrLO_g4209 [Triparma laevis f. longispina]|uniref:Uncharacterized protein n=1 Tax=Triparma laevis f. longispina TaxID=1714387 RepID=A0A9W7FK29_9STRA|nr:hypothetical protein TrLO_g4209 [Triparma laevis f. longispina]
MPQARKQNYVDSLSEADRFVLEELEPTAFSFSLSSLPEESLNPSDTLQTPSSSGYTALESSELTEAFRILTSQKKEWTKVTSHPFTGVLIKTGNITDPQGVDVYSGYAMGDVLAPPEEVLNFIFNFASPERSAFSVKSDLERGELESVNEHHRIFYAAKRLPPPLNPRDIVARWVYKKLKDGRILISNASCEHRRMPLKESQSKGYVRIGKLKSGFLITPSFNGARSVLRYVIQSHPGGYIPAVISNARIKLALGTVWESKEYFLMKSKIFEKEARESRGDSQSVDRISSASLQSDRSLTGTTSPTPGLMPQTPYRQTHTQEHTQEISKLLKEQEMNERDQLNSVMRTEELRETYIEWLPFDTWLTSYLRRIRRSIEVTTEPKETRWIFSPLSKMRYIGDDSVQFNREFRLFRQSHFHGSSMTRTCRRASIHAFAVWQLVNYASSSKIYDSSAAPVSTIEQQLVVMGAQSVLFACLLPWVSIYLFRQVLFLQYTQYSHRWRVTIHIEQCMFIVFLLTFLGLFLGFLVVLDYDYRLWNLCGEERYGINVDLCRGESDAWSFFKTPEMYLVNTIVFELSLCQDLPYFDVYKCINVFRFSIWTSIILFVASSIFCNPQEKPLCWVFLLMGLYGHRMNMENLGEKHNATKQAFSNMWTMYSEIYHYENKYHAQQEYLTEIQRGLLDEVMVQIQKLPKNEERSFINRISYGDIEFERRIGMGKFGLIFLGKFYNRTVAVKQLLPEILDHSTVMHFVAEIHILSCLRHPNILECVGAVLTIPHICLVMEYAKKGSLKEILRTSKGLSWRQEKKRMLTNICSGMNYLHTRERPVMHRDLKTDNCLVAGDMTVKVSDFGLARILPKRGAYTREKDSREDSPSHSKQNKKLQDDIQLSGRIGTPIYMAPEVIKGEQYSEKCDVYSFGMLLADVIMDGRVKKLFAGAGDNGGSVKMSSYRLLKMVAEGWRVDIPPHLAYQVPSVVLMMHKCLAHDPNQRPSFRKLMDNLDAWSGNLDDTKVANLMNNVEPYTIDENEFIERCQALSGNHTFTAGEDFVAPGWFDVRSPDPATTTKIRVTELKHVSYKGRRSQCYVGLAKRNIKAPSHECMQWFWNWMEPERVRKNKEQGEIERSVVEEINEHHQIVSTTKNISKYSFLQPRQGVIRVLWKEITPRNYVMVSESCRHKDRPEMPNIVRTYFMACYIFETRSDGSTNVTYTVTFDIRGIFPDILIKYAIMRNLLHLREAADAVEKEETMDGVYAADSIDPLFDNVDHGYREDGAAVQDKGLNMLPNSSDGSQDGSQEDSLDSNTSNKSNPFSGKVGDLDAINNSIKSNDDEEKLDEAVNKVVGYLYEDVKEDGTFKGEEEELEEATKLQEEYTKLQESKTTLSVKMGSEDLQVYHVKEDEGLMQAPWVNKDDLKRDKRRSKKRKQKVVPHGGGWGP